MQFANSVDSTITDVTDAVTIGPHGLSIAVAPDQRRKSSGKSCHEEEGVSVVALLAKAARFERHDKTGSSEGSNISRIRGILHQERGVRRFNSEDKYHGEAGRSDSFRELK